MRRRRWVLVLMGLLAPGLATAARPAPHPAGRPAMPGPVPKPAASRPASKPALAGPARPSATARRPAGQAAAAMRPAIARRPAPPAAARPAPGQAALPACPPLLAAIAEGIQACHCARGAGAGGEVLGGGPYAGGTATCRAAIHTGAIGPHGGDLVIQVLPLPGEVPGGTRHGIAARTGRLDGRAYALLPGLPGPLAWARRLAQALATPSLPPGRMPGQAEALVPLPLPQAAGLGGLLDAAGGTDRPSLGLLVPPVLMPPLWRSPAGAGLPAADPLSPSAGTPLPAPAPPGPVGGAAQVLGPVRLLVAGIALDLADVEPGEGAEPGLLAAFLARHGGTAQCAPAAGTARQRCVTGDGIDLAEAALYNGLARAAPEASAAYRYAELAAREARRGIWKAETR